MTTEDATRSFSQIKEALAGRDGVTVGAGRGFGSGALKVDGRIFAMLSRDQLVLRLPASRVAELIATGSGGPFDAGKGRPMKEWVTLRGTAPAFSLAEEALSFVRQSSG